MNSTEVIVDHVQVGEVGQEITWADVDCSGGGVAIGDAQKIARSLIGNSVSQTQPCPLIGADTTVDGNPGERGTWTATAAWPSATRRRSRAR